MPSRAASVKSRLHGVPLRNGSLLAGRTQDADHERRSPLPIVLDQDTGRLRELKLERFSAGGVDLQHAHHAVKQRDLAEIGRECSRAIVRFPAAARQSLDRELGGHMQRIEHHILLRSELIAGLHSTVRRGDGGRALDGATARHGEPNRAHRVLPGWLPIGCGLRTRPLRSQRVPPPGHRSPYSRARSAPARRGLPRRSADLRPTLPTRWPTSTGATTGSSCVASVLSFRVSGNQCAW